MVIFPWKLVIFMTQPAAGPPYRASLEDVVALRAAAEAVQRHWDPFAEARLGEEVSCSIYLRMSVCIYSTYIYTYDLYIYMIYMIYIYTHDIYIYMIYL